MPRFPDLLAQRLSRLDVSFQRRVLAPRRGIDFASNDYLGFSQDPVFRGRVLDRLRDADVGSSGSRLLRGQSLLFEKVEQNLAEMSGTEAALIFPSGYQANLALLSGLLSSEDYVFSDQLNHASLIDGMRLSRAHRVVYPHRDWVALRRALTEVASQPGLKVIVTESLFGMDGDQAPLASLVDLADEFEALLVVDEAHATGIWGSEGRGGGAGSVSWAELSGLCNRSHRR
jgi:8-amino-7-oxononanoate synthase